MGGFSVNSGAEGAVWLNGDKSSREGSEPCCVGSTVNWMCGS